MSNTSNNVIEVENLVTYYGDREILKGVTLDVRDGEIMVIMGGSGSGKSTLLRHLMALETKTSGTMSILGRNIDGLNQREFFDLRKKMGVAFQSGALFSSMTIGENVMLPLFEHTDLDMMTMEIMTRMKLEVVELGGFENLMPSELSGGMIKRAAFARAIVCLTIVSSLTPFSFCSLVIFITSGRKAKPFIVLVIFPMVSRIFTSLSSNDKS